ncbi:peptidyl-prolyl cis-trans isomerase [Ferdinandcohnia quinoae]|uniref:peptidylprolyl isomerase n=1 Tax=Fredinandcohnia quinoae TaxID=2918902 RepID=A0AAW5EAL2_9BACI|nr:peptidyl-prolyl cis-trans isomerase [Fredinandcohnia sp. SECRCQ15]MCH1626917.1 peptidyl-prolyl cis-trans isomerase [Fredinandcohnia sp. SECRCQ15]
MNNKIVWSVIIALVVTNCLTVAYFVKGQTDDKSITVSKPIVGSEETDEVVASIGEAAITRQEWLSELETRYGKETLEDMIDGKVVKQMAQKHNITLSEEDVEREMTLIKTMYNTLDSEKIDDEHWQEQIELSLLVEELVTKDAVIPEEELKKFYQENKELYEIPKTYHLSHMIVGSEEEAEQVSEELKSGSSFTALAMEKSLDEFSSNRGGELGYVSADDEYIPQSYIETAAKMSPNEWSTPIQVEEGFAIIILHEVINEVSYSFDEVKNQIRRQIAIDQMNGAISVQPYWDEIGVKWFYEKNKK